ncbi:MAG: putative two-component sensor kinase [Phycisphaerales bacterium]|nr:putative two-component sensor kinase [Phycisphaerales bacterium]
MSAITDQITGGTPFRPRARIIRTLGEELISSETVALVELVKNAYDAEATRVLVRFVGPLEIGKGSIEVIDNGSGMELETVRTVWMEPATPTKRQIHVSKKLKRRVLGAKGIGRFAASRLATDLEVITRCHNQHNEVFALLDWSQFDDDERFLDEVLLLWEERNPIDICPSGLIRRLWKPDEKPSAKDLNHGTLLRMSKLKQAWGKPQFDELQRGLARLIKPGLKGESDFSIMLDLPMGFEEYAHEVEPPKIYKYPMYSLKGNVDAGGHFDLTLRLYADGTKRHLTGRFVGRRDTVARKPRDPVFWVYSRHDDQADGDVSDQDPKETRAPQCGPLEIELRVWDRDELGNVVQKTGSVVSDVRRDLDRIAGINIYRDNFRVLPYGEPRDDWLRLDLRRVQNPTFRLSNNQIVGFISISADGNPLLRDQSNREGLDENQALADLRELIGLMLQQIEEARYKLRHKPSGATPAHRTSGGLFDAFDLQPLRTRLASAHPEDAETVKLIDSTAKAFEKQIKDIQLVMSRYQRLATLGQLIDVVLHDGRQPVTSIINEATLGKENIHSAASHNGSLLSILSKRFSTIHSQGSILATTFRRIEPFGGRMRGKPGQLFLEHIIREAFSVLQSEIDSEKVKVSLPQTETLVRVDRAEIQEVIINLLQNSLYWLQEINEGKRRIEVKVERKSAEHVEIIFSDSGPGVPEDNKDVIFEPYFSTKPEGVGLGLSIAGEIISDYYGGALELLDQGPLSGATFRITLRRRI